MDFKEYLQKLADKDDEKLLTESDIEFCAQLAADVEERPVKKVNTHGVKFWASVSSALAVVILAIIILPHLFPGLPAGDIYYQDGNIVSRDSSLVEMNDKLSNFNIDQTATSGLKVKLYYDSISNNSLYYEVKYSGAISEVKIVIAVNKKYNYKFELDKDLLSSQLNNYLLYYEKAEAGSLGNKPTEYRGKIQLNSEIAYIEYQQLINLGDDAFFEDIQNVLKVKN